MSWRRLAGACVALVACAPTQAGWDNSGRTPFVNAQARCQIETQVVEGPAWEACMVALGWTRQSTHEGGYDVIETKVEIMPDVSARTIEALQITQLRAETTLRELRFDANALTLISASAGDRALTWRVDGRALVFTLPRAYRAGETIMLRFAYAGTPARGLVFEESALYTSYFSCDWMFCALNRPGDKFQFTVDMPIPAGWSIFSSQTVEPNPAFVQGFGAGAFTQVRQRAGDTDFIYASAHASERDLQMMFADTPQMLEFFRQAAGVPFPHATYTQLLVRGGAAQEGAGFAIMGDDTMRPILTNPHEDWAIAHELAHQWWGNLVTCEDWSEFWLNEGIVTFMTAAWKHHRWGEADYQREIDLAQRRWNAAREAGWDRPLAFAGVYPDLRTRRAIQYSKGMLFMVELRRALGEDAFWNGLRAYTRAHAGGTVDSADFQRAMETASGRDLAGLFAQWVYE